MGVLRFIWRGILAFDRIGSRIPQLIQILLIDQEDYYGFGEDAFPDRSPDGRVMMLLSYPEVSPVSNAGDRPPRGPARGSGDGAARRADA